MIVFLLLVLAAACLDKAVSAHHCIREAEGYARWCLDRSYHSSAEQHRWNAIRYRQNRFTGFSLTGLLIALALFVDIWL